MSISHGVRETLKDERDAARLRVAELEALINTPHTLDFLEAVRLEAAHQRERWGAAHDAGKADTDWFWLVGYVAGKAVSKPEKQLHHIITTAAVCLNWHMARTVGNDMRPGILEPLSECPNFDWGTDPENILCLNCGKEQGYHYQTAEGHLLCEVPASQSAKGGDA